MQLKLFNPGTDPEYMQYQQYYWNGFLEEGVELLAAPIPSFKSKLARKMIYQSRAGHIVKRLRPRLKEKYSRYHMFVGQYELTDGHRTVRFAIDSSDSPEIASPDAAKWASVYFKTNYQRGFAKANNIVPLINGNGSLTSEDIEILKSLRNKKKKYDYCYITRALGGYGGNNRAHVVRMAEEISKISVRSKVMIVFPKVRREIAENVKLRNRLKSAGVKIVDNGRQVDRAQLWAAMACSRFVVLREGKHSCASWRVIDAMCMGANIILEQDLKPEWVPKFIKGQHYRSLELCRQPDGSFSEKAYSNASQRLSEWLSDSSAERVNQLNVQYFEEQAAPDRIAKYIFRTLLGVDGSLGR